MKPISDLNLLRSFVKLAELNSFTKAARALNQPKSRVSRAISRLEEQLGVSLVKRTTRHTALTSAGQNLFEKTHGLLQSLEMEVRKVSETSESISGELVITAPEDLSESVLAPLLKIFSAQFPDVQVRVRVTNDYVDLNLGEVDLAIRIGKMPSSGLIQKKLASVGIIAVASPEYLRKYGSAKALEDLKDHRLLLFEKFDLNWLKKGKVEVEKAKVVAQANSFPLLAQMALDGQGVTFLPEFFCRKFISEGRLVRLFSGLKLNVSDVCVVYAPTKALPRRTRAFVDVISREFSNLV